MAHPLEQRMTTLRRRLRRLLTVYGLGWMISALLGTLLVVGFIDYMIRFQDTGIRIICSLAVLAALGWTCYRYLYLPLTIRPRNVDLALHIQRQFPDLDDRLVSSVEFLRQAENDPLAGSASLRRAVVSQTTAEVESLDFGEMLDRRPSLRAAMSAAALCLLAAIVLVASPTTAGIALARLGNPFGATEWPRRTHLELRNEVSLVARGQAFEVQVVDASEKKLPAEVRIHYRFTTPEGTIDRQTEVMLPDGDAMVARRDNITRPFSYRIEGGDDDTMPWIDVEVVEPPTIESLSMTLIPPEYTSWPQETVDKHIRAIEGTQLAISARVNKPLRSAVLHICEEEIPAEISYDGMRFKLPAANGPPLEIERSGQYWFELTDREGLSGGGNRWEIHSVTDSPPSVTIEHPTGELFVTAEAIVPLRVAAKDDLALSNIALVYSISGGEGEEAATVVPLYEGPQKLPKQPAGLLTGSAELGDRRVVDYNWPLESLELEPGTQLDLYATAADYRGQPAESRKVRLVVITPEQLEDRIAGRQSLILAELSRVLKMQRTSRAEIRSLEIRLNELGRLEQLDVDRLQASELGQRRVNRALTDHDEGVPHHILSLLAEMDNNRLDSPDVRRRMQRLLDDIERLEREHLASIDRQLTAAIKTAQVQLDAGEGESPKENPSAALVAAGRHQDAVVAALEKMLGELAQWDNYRRFHREVSQLLRDQEELARGSAELAGRTLAKELKDLLPEELADLKIAAGNQLELSRRLDRIQQEMQQAIGPLQDDDPLAADTLADALAEAERLGIGAQMRDCSGYLRLNQMGQASIAQTQIAEDLQEVLDILANRRQNELVRLVKKLKEAEGDLATLQARHEGLRKKFKDAAGIENEQERRDALKRLQREQRELKEETERMARRLKRLLAERAGRSAEQAAGAMGAAGDAAQQGDAADAADKADKAGKLLEDTKRELAARRLKAQADLAIEQLARLEDSVKHLHRRQKKVVEETQRLEQLKLDAGALSRAQAASLDALTREETALRDETNQLAEKLAGAPAFNFALSSAGRDMGQAVGLLRRRDTGNTTQRFEQNALARLELLLEAVAPEEPPEGDGGDPGGGAGEGQGMPAGGVQTLAEIKLLKLMQEDINLRTKQLQQSIDPETPTDEQRRELGVLSMDQGRLAELIMRLLPQQGNPEDNPDALPEIRQEDPLDPPILEP